MSITREEVEHVAYLARLGLTDEEKGRLAEQLSNILDAMRAIDRLILPDSGYEQPTDQRAAIAGTKSPPPV